MRSTRCLRIGPRRTQPSAQERSRFNRRLSMDLRLRECEPDAPSQQLHISRSIHPTLGQIFRKVTRILGPLDRDELVKYLRLYKSGRTNEGFESTLTLLRI